MLTKATSFVKTLQSFFKGVEIIPFVTISAQKRRLYTRRRRNREVKAENKQRSEVSSSSCVCCPHGVNQTSGAWGKCACYVRVNQTALKKKEKWPLTVGESTELERRKKSI